METERVSFSSGVYKSEECSSIKSLVLLFRAMLVLPAYALLAVGPALALYGVFIGRRRPFLFLVTLAR